MNIQVNKPRRADLQEAYTRANDALETLRRTRFPTPEEELCLDIASIIVEAIVCMSDNERIQTSGIIRIARYKKYGQDHLVKLGYSLSVLVNSLLMDRVASKQALKSTPAKKSNPTIVNHFVPSTSNHMQEASTSSGTLPQPFEGTAEINDDPLECQPSNSPAKTSTAMIVNQFVPSASNHPQQASTSTYSQELPIALSATAEIKEEPLDDFESGFLSGDMAEVKEEPLDCVDVKEEEIDGPLADVFCPSTGSSRPLKPKKADVKQEESEEPLADVFCPSTGASRQLAPKRAARNETQLEENSSSQPGTSSNEMTNTQRSVTVVKMRKDANGRVVPTKVDRRLSTHPSNYVGQGRACYLCAAITTDYETTPLFKDREARDEFLNRIIMSNSKISRDRINCLRNMRVMAYFCKSHLAPPLRTDASNTDDKNLSCDLCDDPSYPLQQAPLNPFSRRRFFGTLVKLTPEQQAKVDSFVKNTQSRPVFCLNHFKSHEKPKIDHLDKKGERFVSAITARKSSIVRKEMLRNSQPIVPPINVAFPRVSPVRVDVGYPKEPVRYPHEAEMKEEVKEEPIFLSFD